jgi:hypothetical protein
MDHNQKRAYIRTDIWDVSAKISMDRKNWDTATVPNISADGLLFNTDRVCHIGEILWLELEIDPHMPSIEKFMIAVHCKVVSDRGNADGTHSYSGVFNDLSTGNRIRLDELITMTVHKYGS